MILCIAPFAPPHGRRVQMEHRHLELAAEFCKLVNVADLLVYLKADAQTDSDAARRLLKARRKYMQGMQGNPKYKKEALFLIKHFSALDAVLTDLDAYLADTRARAESVHLPILEMTVRGVLTAGSLTFEQEQYLRRNATELGVSASTFEALLSRITAELGVARPAPPDAVPPIKESPPLAPQSTGDFYRFLDVSPAASHEEIEAAWRKKRLEINDMAPSPQRDELKVKLEIAWNVLQDRHAREQYDLSARRTPPPAGPRKVRPDQAATAPPVRRQVVPPSPKDAGRPARLEVHGEPVRVVSIGDVPTTEQITIRNIGDQPLNGTVSPDVVWLRAEPSQLDPGRTEQQIQVVIDPTLLPGDTAHGRVHIVADPGGRATVDFQVQRAPAWGIGAWTAGAAVVLLLMLGLVYAMLSQAGPGSSGLTLHIDPGAAEVKLDGRVVGAGSRVEVPEPPLGPVTVTVTHPNFDPWTKELRIERGRATRLDVRLSLARAMDFRPAPEMVKGTVDEQVAKEVMGDRRAGFDACIEAHAQVGQILTGTVRVHVGPEGHAQGFEIQGRHADDPNLRQCLQRQAAAVTLPPLQEGDYATVRYDYTVTATER